MIYQYDGCFLQNTALDVSNRRLCIAICFIDVNMSTPMVGRSPVRSTCKYFITQGVLSPETDLAIS
jgi:hypothetical protein